MHAPPPPAQRYFFNGFFATVALFVHPNICRDLLEAKRLADDPLIPPEVTEAHQEHP